MLCDANGWWEEGAWAGFADLHGPGSGWHRPSILFRAHFTPQQTCPTSRQRRPLRPMAGHSATKVSTRATRFLGDSPITFFWIPWGMYELPWRGFGPGWSFSVLVWAFCKIIFWKIIIENKYKTLKPGWKMTPLGQILFRATMYLFRLATNDSYWRH